MRTIIPVAAMLGLAPLCPAETITVGNVEGRASVSLDGAWHAIVDPYEVGLQSYRAQPLQDGFFLARPPRSESDLVEYDFDRSPTLLVPGDWNTQRESLLYYEGTIWYMRRFTVQPQPHKRYVLWFGAANYEAQAWLNGQRLGSHEGGFTPFAFEVTAHLRAGENVVVVKVDNRRRDDGVPTSNTDWWNYGGLTRHVRLIELPETFLADYLVQLEPGSRSRIAGWVKLDGPQAAQRVTIDVREAGASTTIVTGDDGWGRFAFDAPLTLWSPEQPKLYAVAVRAETDEVREDVGFRSIETRGTEIVLNGEPIFLRGISVHEEAPFRSGRAFSREDARTLLGWVKDLEGNFARLAHYPHNSHMTREADRMGILIWSEIPVYWTIHWDDPQTYANAQRQLEEMIARDRNRASVILWSVANETPVTESRNAFLGKLIDRARELDPTRLLTAALERHYEDERTQVIDDPLGAKLDVVGCNEYVGWYDGLPEKADDLAWKMVYDKPLIMSELGGGARFGHHGSPRARWTEEYQESLYQHQTAMLDRIPFLRGTTPWILMDFRSPRRVLPVIQDGWNRKGLISDRGERKQAFFVLRDWYRAKKAVWEQE